MSDNTQEIREKIRHYLISTQQDGAGIATGRRSTDGSLYKSRIDEFTEMIMSDIKSQTNQAVLEARIDELERTAKYAGAWMNPSTGERTSNWVNMEVVNSRLSTLRQELTQEVQTDE